MRPDSYIATRSSREVVLFIARVCTLSVICFINSSLDSKSCLPVILEFAIVGAAQNISLAFANAFSAIV